MKKCVSKLLQILLIVSLMTQTAIPGFSNVVFAAQIGETDMVAEETTLFTVNEEQPQRTILFNEDWKFYLGNPTNAQRKEFDDSTWGS